MVHFLVNDVGFCHLLDQLCSLACSPSFSHLGAEKCGHSSVRKNSFQHPQHQQQQEALEGLLDEFFLYSLSHIRQTFCTSTLILVVKTFLGLELKYLRDVQLAVKDDTDGGRQSKGGHALSSPTRFSSLSPLSSSIRLPRANAPAVNEVDMEKTNEYEINNNNKTGNDKNAGLEIVKEGGEGQSSSRMDNSLASCSLESICKNLTECIWREKWESCSRKERTKGGTLEGYMVKQKTQTYDASSSSLFPSTVSEISFSSFVSDSLLNFSFLPYEVEALFASPHSTILKNPHGATSSIPSSTTDNNHHTNSARRSGTSSLHCPADRSTHLPSGTYEEHSTKEQEPALKEGESDRRGGRQGEVNVDSVCDGKEGDIWREMVKVWVSFAEEGLSHSEVEVMPLFQLLLLNGKGYPMGLADLPSLAREMKNREEEEKDKNSGHTSGMRMQDTLIEDVRRHLAGPLQRLGIFYLLLSKYQQHRQQREKMLTTSALGLPAPRHDRDNGTHSPQKEMLFFHDAALLLPVCIVDQIHSLFFSLSSSSSLSVISSTEDEKKNSEFVGKGKKLVVGTAAVREGENEGNENAKQRRRASTKECDGKDSAASSCCLSPLSCGGNIFSMIQVCNHFNRTYYHHHRINKNHVGHDDHNNNYSPHLHVPQQRCRVDSLYPLSGKIKARVDDKENDSGVSYTNREGGEREVGVGKVGEGKDQSSTISPFPCPSTPHAVEAKMNEDDGKRKGNRSCTGVRRVSSENKETSLPSPLPPVVSLVICPARTPFIMGRKAFSVPKGTSPARMILLKDFSSLRSSCTTGADDAASRKPTEKKMEKQKNVSSCTHRNNIHPHKNDDGKEGDIHDRKIPVCGAGGAGASFSCETEGMYASLLPEEEKEYASSAAALIERRMKNERVDLIQRASNAYYYHQLLHCQDSSPLRSSSSHSIKRNQSASMGNNNNTNNTSLPSAAGGGRNGVRPLFEELFDIDQFEKYAGINKSSDNKKREHQHNVNHSSTFSSPYGGGRSPITMKSMWNDLSIGVDVLVMLFSGAAIGYFLGAVRGVSECEKLFYTIVGVTVMLFVDGFFLITRMHHEDHEKERALRRRRTVWKYKPKSVLSRSINFES